MGGDLVLLFFDEDTIVDTGKSNLDNMPIGDCEVEGFKKFDTNIFSHMTLRF